MKEIEAELIKPIPSKIKSIKGVYVYLNYIYKKEDGIKPYFIGQHEGLCDKPFIVIKENDQLPTLGTTKTGQKIIDFIVFVPLNSYIELEECMKKVRSTLKEITYLRKTGIETPAIVDDDKKAYTTSIEYVIQKKLEE